MKNSWSSPGGQQRMKIPWDIRRRWWHQKKIMISRDTRRGKRHLERTTMPSSSASSFRPVDTSSLSSSATDWTLGLLTLSSIQTQGFSPKTSFDWICYSINVRMIWKDWNSDYVAEKPYLTPIKVGHWLVQCLYFYLECHHNCHHDRGHLKTPGPKLRWFKTTIQMYMKIN